MTFWQGTKYGIKNCWLWPLLFWMKPLSMLEDARQHQRKGIEAVVAALAGAIWGALVGVAHWQWTGNPHSILLLSFAFAFAFGVIGVIGVIGGIGVGVGVGVGVSVGVGVVVGGVIGGVYLLLVAIGVFLGTLFSSETLSYFFIFINVLFILFSILKYRSKDSDFIASTFAIIWLVLLPASAFSLFPHLEMRDASSWGVLLFVSFGFGGIAVFFNETLKLIKRKSLQLQKGKQINYLLFFWLFFSILALGAYFLGPEAMELDQKLDILALFLILIPILFTGLPLYPLLAFGTLWQSRRGFVENYNSHQWKKLVSFRCQSFAYPLPGIGQYLKNLAQIQGSKAAFQTIQQLQFWSLQIAATQRASLELGQEKSTAISFTGVVATQTNTSTLLPFSLAGNAARSIAILGREKVEGKGSEIEGEGSEAENKRKEQPLQLYLGEFPPSSNQNRLLFLGKKQGGQEQDSIQEFLQTSKMPLAKRVGYALDTIQNCQEFDQYTEYHQFLSTLHSFLEIQKLGDLQTIQKVLPLLDDQEESIPSWLQGGWQAFRSVQLSFPDLEEYRDLKTQAARREFLSLAIQKLQSQEWESLPEFWGNLGVELTHHLIEVFQKEREEVREWLRLELSLKGQEWTLGKQEVLFDLKNPTGVIAKDIRIQVKGSDHFFWPWEHVRHPLLEGGESTELPLDVDFQKQGSFLLEGELHAIDLSGNPLQQGFNFRIAVGEKGIPYQISDVMLYRTGEGLSGGDSFVGRKELFHWLRSLWKQPDGKPAVVLIGQRRIGKTSMLNRIMYEGVEDLQLLPVLINIQGCGSDYDFLQETTRKMADCIEQEIPVLDKQEPYADFKSFLFSLKKELGKRRFLLMLDEADLIPERKLGDLLPGFLRSLMQEHDYPTLLLFCGTHALKRVGREYSSIFFNTTQMKTVSYMNEKESAEVLSKPGQGVLDFDPTVLKEAYRLTRGQPLLLQMIGANLVQNLNREFFNDESPNNFINLNRLQEAVEGLVRDEGNMAFENHWHDSDWTTHKILSVLAWVTTNRPQTDIDGLEEALQKHRLSIKRKPLFDRLQQLTEEEIFIHEGPTYRFAVPLYREWVSWRWKPELVREEEDSE